MESGKLPSGEPLLPEAGPGHIAIPVPEVPKVPVPGAFAKVDRSSPAAKEAKPSVPYYKLFRQA